MLSPVVVGRGPSSFITLLCLPRSLLRDPDRLPLLPPPAPPHPRDDVNSSQPRVSPTTPTCYKLDAINRAGLATECLSLSLSHWSRAGAPAGRGPRGISPVGPWRRPGPRWCQRCQRIVKVIIKTAKQDKEKDDAIACPVLRGAARCSGLAEERTIAAADQSARRDVPFARSHARRCGRRRVGC